MRSTVFTRGILALAAVAAAVFAAGIQVDHADAQTTVVSAGGPYQGIAGQPIQFNGVLFSGSAIAATWTFSDGTSSDGLAVVKTFAVPGSYSATLTVTDASGFVFSDTTTVTVLAATTATAVIPDGFFLIDGQLISAQSLVALLNADLGIGDSVIRIDGQLVPVQSLAALLGQSGISIASLLGNGSTLIDGQIVSNVAIVGCDRPNNPFVLTCMGP